MAHASTGLDNGSPFVDYDRASWAELAPRSPLPLTQDDLARVRSAGDMLDAEEVTEVYQPLARLLAIYVEGARHLHYMTRQFLGDDLRHTPFIIGIAGSVAVGKSTTSRVLKTLLERNPDTPNVALIATDGFLLPLAELKKRGLLERKGSRKAMTDGPSCALSRASKAGCHPLAPRSIHTCSMTEFLTKQTRFPTPTL